MAPAAAVTPNAPSTLPPTSIPNGIPWTAVAQTTVVPEMRGNPLRLPPGERCKTFRSLPTLSYGVDTLVEDGCLKIPNDTVIEVKNGATLAIVATSGLSVGKNVRFDARGARGLRGGRAAFSSLRYSPATDVEIQALCVDHGNHCACPGSESELALIRGQAGSTGSPGGEVRLLAEELVSPSKLEGFAIDVSGGDGGPPGDSGRQECWRGTFRCSSGTCSTGAVFGAVGANGKVFVALGGAVNSSAIERIKKVLGPADGNDAMLVGRGVTIAEQADALDAEAIQQGWQRRAGQQPY